MGYDFSFEQPSNEPGASYRFNTSQMSIVREILREVGAVTAPGSRQALELDGCAPTADSVPLAKFTSNNNWHVTPVECRFLASRLREGIARRVASELLSFYDDAPPTREVTTWLEEFAGFNERAADHGGYRVR